MIRRFEIRICDDCLHIRGQMCHNPECVFIRRTMREVGEILDLLLIRPVINKKRIEEILCEIPERIA